MSPWRGTVAGEGFASFPPVDRLEALTLPELADVADGLERYLDNKERPEELEEKIEKTEELIDEIVYRPN